MTQKKEKIAQLSKDLLVSAKDILEMMKAVGIEKKTGSSLEGVELEIFFDRITEANQLENLEEYVNGTAKIIMPTPKVEKKPEPKPEPPKEEKKAPAAPAAQIRSTSSESPSRMPRSLFRMDRT
ncbi:MAG: hypothetical protein IJ012_00490, partial [Clostridia bacterium]|nr:hypothetical protein [Clostridia bacterium]